MYGEEDLSLIESLTDSDLVNVFSIFLPQLLLYPNAQDSLNGHAANLYQHSPKLYEEKVRSKPRTQVFFV